MSRYVYPSDDFPPVPTVSVECPEGWQPLGAAGVLMAVAAPEVTAEFRPNVVVTWARFSDGCTIQSAFDDLIAKYRSEKPDLEIVGTRDTEVGGRAAMFCEVTFGSADAGTLVQTSLAVVIDHGAVRDLIWVCGTCSAGQIESALSTLRESVGSLTVVG